MNDISNIELHHKVTPYSLGFSVFGPMFLGVACFIAKKSIERGYKTLFFASRDGYYMKAAYDELRFYYPSLPESRYFVSSRKLANISSIQTISDVERIAKIDFFPCSLNKLLASRFDIDPEDTKKIPLSTLESLGLSSFDEIINQENGRGKFVSLAKHLFALIIEKASKTRVAYITYLKSIGIDESNSAIVDIGYSGTIQIALTRLLNKPIGGLYFVTWERAKQLDEANLIFDSFLGNKIESSHYFNKYIQLFELIFSATHPSIIGITQSGTKEFCFAYDKSMFSQAVVSMLAELHYGAINFVINVASYTPKNIKIFDEISSGRYCEPAFRFFADPTPHEASLFKDILFEDDFGGDIRTLIFKLDRAQPVSQELAEFKSIWKEGCKALTKVGKAFYSESRSEIGSSLHDYNGTCYVHVDTFSGFEIKPGYIEDKSSKHSNKELGKPSKPNLMPPSWLIIVIVHENDLKFVDSFMCSVIGQLYTNWNVIFVDATNGHDTDVSHELNKWTLYFPDKNIQCIGRILRVSEQIQKILQNFEGVVFTRPSARLKPDFLAEITLAILESDVDFIYTDHEIIEDTQTIDSLIFKPSWSPELLLSENYIGKVYAVRAALANSLLTSIPEEILFQDYPRTLKAASISKTIHHIARVLWEDCFVNEPVKTNQNILAIKEVFRNYEIECDVVEYILPNGKITYRPIFPQTGPSVAIIIPTKNALDILTVCVESLNYTLYDNFKVYIIDNESDEPSALDYFSKSKHNILRISNPNGQFNYSHINNRAVEMVNEDFILFLNNDTEVINPAWLGQMVGWARIPGVGSVGARLIFQNGKIQHAGLINGILYSTLPAPAFKLIDRGDPGYLGHSMVAKNYSAMTAACLLTPRNLFLDIGGFNESEFGVAYNDCDYGFRLTLEGYRNVYCPDAELYHYEGYTRGIGIGNDKPSEEAECVKRYGLWADPFYNQNLEKDCTDFNISTRTNSPRAPDCFPTLFVTHNLNHEGAPLVLSEIVCGVHLAGLTKAIVLSPKNGPLREKYESIGIEVVILENLPFFGAKDPAAYNQAIYQIRQHIERLSPKVIFANTILSWWAIDVASDIGIPSIWCIHESETPFSHFNEHGKFLKANARRCLSYPYQVVFVAHSTRKLFEPLAERNNLMVIHNGFDPQRLNEQVKGINREDARLKLGIQPNELMILTVGTVCERKNQKELIEALRLLKPECVDKIKVFVVGNRDSSYSQELHHMLDSLSHRLSSKITVVMETGDVGVFYLCADIFVLTSRLESFPVVIQEAMYFSLPIVAHPSFGIREQVINEVSALFYSSADCEELAEKLMRLATSSELRSKLGSNAKISLGRLPTTETMVKNYSDVIKEAWLSAKSRCIGI